MKRCKCGSYAVNIEKLTGENCDVCHYKNQLETLRAENAKLRQLPAQQVPIYQWNSTNDKTLWVDCNKDVYDIMRDEHRRIVYLSAAPKPEDK